MNYRSHFIACSCFILSLATFHASAAITYDAELNRVRIIDFPSEQPCTMANLLSMDKAGGWGKVTHDATTNTYTVALDIWIGDRGGTETYFQIGGSDQAVTVIMKGNVVVHPFFVRGVDEGAYYRAAPKVNRLTLGAPDGADVALKFDCETKNQYSLYVGVLPAADGKPIDDRGYGGEFFAYNALITAATQDKAHTWGDPERGMVHLRGNRTTLHNTTLSWAGNALTYGLNHHPPLFVADVRKCVFEHARSGLINGSHLVRDSVFRNLDIAVQDYGGIDATLIGCTFENNQANFKLRFTKKGIACIDCDIAPPLAKDLLLTGTTASITEPRYPTLTIQRRIVVQVKDKNGNPVQGASVRVTNEQDDHTKALNAAQTTDAAGRTADIGSAEPMVLTDTVKQVTDTPYQPAVHEYSYIIEARAEGKGRARIDGYRPVKNGEIVTLTLEK